MNVEIERKFLVCNGQFPKELATEVLHLAQGYLSISAGRTVRVRVANDKGYLCVKGKSSGISRLEYEYEIPKNDALSLLKICLPGVIRKTRYKIPFAQKVWEIDVFEAENEGLILAEVELQSADEHIQIPEWIAQEVSGDVRYYNSYLSQCPYKIWEK